MDTGGHVGPPLRRIRKSSLLFVGAGHWPARVPGDHKGCPYKKGGKNLPPHPPQCAHWGTFPLGEGLYRRVRISAPAGIVGEKRWAHNVRPYSAFTNGSIYKKRDRSGTCPLKRRGEAELRRKFFCLLFFQEKEGTRRPRAGSGS